MLQKLQLQWMWIRQQRLGASKSKETLPAAGALQRPGRTLGSAAPYVSFSYTSQRAERAFHFWYKAFWGCLLTKTSFVPADSNLTKDPWMTLPLGLSFIFPSQCICPTVSATLPWDGVPLCNNMTFFLLCLEIRKNSKCAKHVTVSQWYKLHRGTVLIVQRSDSFKVTEWLSDC